MAGPDLATSAVEGPSAQGGSNEEVAETHPRSGRNGPDLGSRMGARRCADRGDQHTPARSPGSSPELCVKVRGSSSMLRLGCLGDLLRFEKREIEVAAFAPDRSSPQSNRGDEAERTGSVGEGAGAPDPTLDLGVQALEAVRGA